MTDVEQTAEPTRTADPTRSRSPDAEAFLAAGEQVARFHVLRLVGEGGMSKVYSAYDPKLDRKVALKVLHIDRASDDGPRLVREALALARLSHPNIVGVHDVGVHNERWYIAMEFVEGTTLREWLRSSPPSDAKRQLEAIELLAQAGRGLAAVHAAGLVHRDFKPGNILVGSDGRARVADFGIVRIDGGSPSSAEQTKPDNAALHATRDDNSDANPQLEDGALTRSGAILGTPAYMAPEQLLGAPAATTADVFAFCVTAWETLFGRRPFPTYATAGRTLDAIRNGAPPKPTDGLCPDALETTLRRGLSFSHRRRHREMTPILSELESAAATLRGDPRLNPKSSSKQWAYVVGGSLLAVGVTWFATTTENQPCTGAAAALDGVWDDETRDSVRRQFAKSGASFAPKAWANFEEQLDDYASVWMDGHQDACEAAQVRREQSVHVMELRMACLDDRRRDFEAVVEVYKRDPSRAAIANSHQAAASLATAADCADVEYVQQRGRIPTSGEAGDRARAVLAKVSRSKAISDAGEPLRAADTAAEAVRDAEALHNEAVLARALLHRGKLHRNLRRAQEARDDLERAYLLSPHGDPVAFDAAVALVQFEGADRRHETARTWERIARSEAPRAEHWRRLADLHTAIGHLRQAEGRLAEAQENFDEARRILEARVGSSDFGYAKVTADVARIQTLRGDPEGAIELLASSLRTAESTLGKNHPALSWFHRSLCHAQIAVGQFPEGLRHARRAVELKEDAFGPEHVALFPELRTLAIALSVADQDTQALQIIGRAHTLSVPRTLHPTEVARLLALEGSIHVRRQKPTEAEPKLRRAMELTSGTLGDLHPDTIAARVELGTTLAMLGRHEEGTLLVESSVALADAAIPEEDPQRAVLYDQVAHYWELRGEMAQAADYSTRALNIFQAVYGAKNHQLLPAHGNLCAQLGHLGRLEEAIQHCMQAVEIVRSSGIPQLFQVGDIENNYGAALARAKRWRDARTHYQAAHEIWKKTLPPNDIRIGILLSNLAECEAALERPHEAQRLYERSLQVREQAAGPDHRTVVLPLVSIAHLMLQRGEIDDAKSIAHRAFDVATESGTPLDLARSQEALARALFQRPTTRHNAQRLLNLALDTYRTKGELAAPDLERVRRWMKDTSQ